MASTKKRIIKSLEKLTDDLKELLNEQYPGGYEGSISRITNAKKEPIFVFPLETEDSIYLIKVPAIKNSDGEYDVEKKDDDEFGDTDSGAGDSDDDYGSGGDEADADDDYDGGGKRGGKEASYDPDFD